MPEQAKESLSSCNILASDMAESWCPQVAIVKAEPEKSLRACLLILAIFAILIILNLDLASLSALRLAGRFLPAAFVIPKSLVCLLLTKKSSLLPMVGF